jgi:hypothetical protein
LLIFGVFRVCGGGEEVLVVLEEEDEDSVGAEDLRRVSRKRRERRMGSWDTGNEGKGEEEGEGEGRRGRGRPSYLNKWRRSTLQLTRKSFRNIFQE